jgi:Phage portal protein
LAFLDGFRRVWNAFRNPIVEPTQLTYGTTSYNGGSSPSRNQLRIYNDRTIVSAIYARLSIDVADIRIKHVKLDEQKRYLGDIDSAFNTCLTLEPNIDQGPRAWRQDAAITMFDRGCAALVPVDAMSEPDEDGFTDILTLRVADITEWYPKHVRVNLYNEAKGQREEIVLPKNAVAIVENPLYSVMNEPNSTLQRLVRKLSLLDAVDEQSSSGKLDIIIQLPYVIKSEAKKQQAIARREDIELQLRGSQYGIAYIDGTEKITQLNRPAENNLLKQVEYLTNLLYNQLGLTEEVMNGTADEAAMINYFNRTIYPIVDGLVEAMQRTFIGAAGVARNEAVKSFRDPFKYTPLSDLAEIADKFTRNEIATSNEVRGWLGLAPHPDPKADKLINSNMPQQPLTSEVGNLERNRQNGSSGLQRVGD